MKEPPDDVDRRQKLALAFAQYWGRVKPSRSDESYAQATLDLGLAR